MKQVRRTPSYTTDWTEGASSKGLRYCPSGFPHRSPSNHWPMIVLTPGAVAAVALIALLEPGLFST